MAVKGLALCHGRIQQGPLLLKGKEEAHHTSQKEYPVRESTLPASLNFSEGSYWSAGSPELQIDPRREDQLMVGLC